MQMEKGISQEHASSATEEYEGLVEKLLSMAKHQFPEGSRNVSRIFLDALSWLP